ncbi:MAG TPA: phosphotransferase [Anaerolineales bacterium]|nr:phosphotransferase [Anaerolineales bacterium]
MSDSTDILIQRAHAIMPDLEIEQFERNQEGLINDVVIVNQEFVFRFAKSEEYARMLGVEMKILDLVRPHLGIGVPTPVYRSSDCIVYPLLSGQPLSCKTIKGFVQSTQSKIAEQLGRVLYRLHTTDISKVDWELPSTRAPVRRQDWLDIQERVKEKIFPLLQAFQIQWVEELFNSVLEDPGSSLHEPALIHGDLASYHILFDDQERKITGVIDFGMAGMGDAASDIGSLINIYGESFVKRMHKSYPNLEKYLLRARFYAQLLELEWVLLGIETGETFWFTAHLGGARDVQ